ncbi:MAG: tetratricopeptide repeat protein [Polaromonas sp.]|uniref:tetratricopeptide repeat protein n=1 Tax=Polaromonas sp. TaxID=1869339 RepID=UPI0024884A7C|nr:tetratricopeptide repeat protein [Polaromonas sp.]MDI1269660.1 tetratricopeptide repeat protein [Polaromonas sp.]
MFEIIGIAAVVWFGWQVFKAIAGIAIKKTLFDSVDYAVRQGVPLGPAMVIIEQPEVVKTVRRDLAKGNRAFGALDIHEQYGHAIVALYSSTPKVENQNRTEQKVTSFQQPQVAEPRSSVVSGAAITAQTYEQSVAAYEREDYQIAFEGFKNLAEQGDASAQNNLGQMYVKGEGAARDPTQALNWWTKAAAQGYVDAQFNLGRLYAKGEGVSQDYQQAAAWYRKAAEQGEADAQFILGQMYAKGEGVPQDDQQVVAWYLKAAAKGHARAQFNLGVKFYTGAAGVSQDYQQAAAWYRKAAEQGHAGAQYNLGSMYYNALGVSKDVQMAYFWWLLSSAQGDKNATKGRDISEQQLSPDQRAATRGSVRKWEPKTAEQSSDATC